MPEYNFMFDDASWKKLFGFDCFQLSMLFISEIENGVMDLLEEKFILWDDNAGKINAHV